MISFINPYVEELQKAIKTDQQDLQQDLEEKWKSFNSELLKGYESQVNTLKNNYNSFKADNSALSLNKQYKASIKLYKDTRDLLLAIRKLKKEIREGLK